MSRKKLILVVEPSVERQKRYLELFSSSKVVVTDGIAEALVFHENTEQKLDLVLINLDSNDENGIDFYRKIRKLDSRVPMIAIPAPMSKDADYPLFEIASFLPSPFSRSRVLKLFAYLFCGTNVA